jgi:hypothetical protein
MEEERRAGRDELPKRHLIPFRREELSWSNSLLKAPPLTTITFIAPELWKSAKAHEQGNVIVQWLLELDLSDIGPIS